MTTVYPINFCQPEFQPRIACDQACADGYEPSNLINATAPQNGCRAEYFIRPPLTVTLKFPCNIDLHKIIINGKIGCTTSVGFEVQAYSDAQRSDTWLDSGNYNNHLDASEIQSDAFRSVGKIWNNDNPVICFNNSHFRLSQRFASLRDSSVSRSNGSETVFGLKHHVAGASLYNVTCLRIRVIKTLSGSVPGLSWIEVWGQPSPRCSDELSRKLYSIASAVHHRKSYQTLDAVRRQSLEFTEILSGKRSRKESVESCDISPKQAVKAEVNIPDEFLDEITFHIMSLPVLLPSGHCIDQYTLDRHNMEQARWGRDPNDPFTGVPLSDFSRPLPNSALKVRIDSFLLKHSDVLTDVPQTLGRESYKSYTSTENETFRNSVLLNKPKKRSAEGYEPDMKTEYKKPRCEDQVQSYASFLPHTFYSSAKKTSPSLKNDSFFYEDDPKAELKKKQKAVLNAATPIVLDTSPKSCLDSALKSALSGLPSYTMSTLPPSTESFSIKNKDCYLVTTDAQLVTTCLTLTNSRYQYTSAGASNRLHCVQCDRVSDINVLYILPCDRLCCRRCVLSLTSGGEAQKCNFCGCLHPPHTIQKAQS